MPNSQKFFRNKGNKDGAVKAMKMLEKDGLGKVYEDEPICGKYYIAQLLHVICMYSLSHNNVIEMYRPFY